MTPQKWKFEAPQRSLRTIFWPSSSRTAAHHRFPRCMSPHCVPDNHITLGNSGWPPSTCSFAPKEEAPQVRWRAALGLLHHSVEFRTSSRFRPDSQVMRAMPLVRLPALMAVLSLTPSPPNSFRGNTNRKDGVARQVIRGCATSMVAASTLVTPPDPVRVS
jgi:hypothetical protein